MAKKYNGFKTIRMILYLGPLLIIQHPDFILDNYQTTIFNFCYIIRVSQSLWPFNHTALNHSTTVIQPEITKNRPKILPKNHKNHPEGLPKSWYRLYLFEIPRNIIEVSFSLWFSSMGLTIVKRPYVTSQVRGISVVLHFAFKKVLLLYNH